MKYAEALKDLKLQRNKSPYNEYKLKVIQTQRSRGAVGHSPIAVKYVREHADHDDYILDFGCGYYGSHVFRLITEDGFNNVYGYDLMTDPERLPIITPNFSDLTEREWDWIIVSNVINVQPTVGDVYAVVMDIRSLSTPQTTVVMNYPNSPRKSGIGDEDFNRELRLNGFVVERVRTGSGKLYICKVGV